MLRTSKSSLGLNQAGGMSRNVSSLDVSSSGYLPRAASSQDILKMQEILIKQPSTAMESHMIKQSNAWSIGDVDEDDAQRKFDDYFVADFQRTMEKELSPDFNKRTTLNFLDFTPLVKDGVESIVKDSFTRCFRSKTVEHWNWNAYLFILYSFGVVLRYFILFPLRLLILLLGFMFFFTAKPAIAVLFKQDLEKQREYERKLIQFMCLTFAMSWSSVIKFHGIKPKRRPNQVYVANHTSLIDVVVLGVDQTYSMVGQRHVGFVGILQDVLLKGMDCLWFNRLEAKDRQMVSQKIREHVRDPSKPPLLIFPEGTCVNNKHIVMFKRGAFDIDATVCPIAIKYNKVFVDAFWNSKKQSFAEHLFSLMTSWAVVADVYYLEPQTRHPDESVTAFADRVKKLIAKRANLVPVPWDGYLKYYRPRASFMEHRQRVVANLLRYRFNLPEETSADKEQDQENDRTDKIN